MSAIIASELTKLYGNQHLAVDSIDFEVQTGEVFGFLGPNGAGKSTTISMITGISKPSKGNLTVLNNKMPEGRRNIQTEIGFVPQDLVFYNHLTVKENLQLFATSYGVNNINQRIDEAIYFMKMEEFQNQTAETLSGGQKRRLNVAIGVLNTPQLLVLDEPSAGMDPQSRNVLWESISELSKEDLTIILTTHLMETADLLSDRICIIDHGKIKAIDTPKNLKSKLGEGDIIQLHFTKDLEPNHILSITDAIHSSDPNSKLHKIDDVTVNITVKNGINVLSDIIGSIRQTLAGNTIDTINLRDNTLEDVFIELTGRKLRE